ncbi:hypothetical protein C0993_003635 [Termitomyces sp. T159_Od127]|nr:hypothetical protein C0993_003635 [Termitomyces sp. T159_Od127]
MPPVPVPSSLPPSYPSPYTQAQRPPNFQAQVQDVQPSLTGQPLLQSSYGGFPPQQIAPGIRPPIGTFPSHALPGQLPSATAPTDHVSQPSLGGPAQQMSGMNLYMMQAQLGAQYQAAPLIGTTFA